MMLLMSNSVAGLGGALVAKTADRLRDLIDGGAYAPGERIPSVRSLATDWAISPSTVVHAYQRLVDEGTLMNLPRMGFRVLAKPQASRLARQPEGVGKPIKAVVADEQLRLLADAERLPWGHLATALPDPDLLPRAELQSWVRRCLREDPDCGLDYKFGAGELALRRQFARRFGLRGRRADPDEVVITNGCTEALMLTLRCLCAPGDVVAVESPTYFNHLRMLEHLRLRVVEIPVDPQEGLDPAVLDEACQRHEIKALISVPILQNPLGVTLSAERQRAILACCERHQVAVVEDIIYAGLGGEDERPPLFRDHDSSAKVVTCGSVSKTLVPGWRIGYVLAGGLRDKILEAKLVSSMGAPTLHQRALAGFLAANRAFQIQDRAATIYRERLSRGRALILQHFPKGTRCSDPSGGMALWIQVPQSVDVGVLYDRATAKGLCFAPGSVFGLHHRHPQHLRIATSRLDAAAAGAIADIGRMACQMS